jgi:hypothetical protein
VRRPDDAAALALLATLASASEGGLSYGSLKNGLREAIARDPFDANVVVVVGGAFLFYLAEKGKNPKVSTYWDALVFVSTCMSVGYADVFARTPAGQAIASAVMALGPALSGAMLDAPRDASRDAAGGAGAGSDAPGGEASRQKAALEAEKVLAIQRVIVDKLEAILGELRAARQAR